MLESSPTCPAPNYSYVVPSPEGVTLVAPQLNYIINIVLELKVKLAQIKTKINKIKKHLSIIHLSLVNEIRHSEKSTLSISTLF